MHSLSCSYVIGIFSLSCLMNLFFRKDMSMLTMQAQAMEGKISMSDMPISCGKHLIKLVSFGVG